MKMILVSILTELLVLMGPTNDIFFNFDICIRGYHNSYMVLFEPSG